MDMTRPSGHDQPEDPIKIQHPEEEEHHESRASKMFGRVKARAKKIKNSLTTKQGNEHDQDVDEEDDDIDEQLQEASAVRDGVTGQPLSHPGETHVPLYTKPIEPEPSRDTTHGHEAPSYPVTSEKEETREELSRPVKMSDTSDREESREAHHVPVNTHVPLLSETEDVPRKFAPDEDEYLGGQREVNVEAPKRSEEERSGVSKYQSNVSDPTQQVNNFGGVPEIAESLGKLKVADGSSDQESGLGFGRDLPPRRQESDMETEAGIGEDSPARYGGGSGIERGEDVPIRSFEFDEKKSEIDKNSQAAFGSESGAETEEDLRSKSHDFDQKIESGTGEDLPTGFGGKSGAGKREEFLAKSHEFDQEIESGIGKDPPTRLPEEDLPARSHEFEQKIESGTVEDLPTGFGGKSGAGKREQFLAKSHEFDQEIESGIGKDPPTRLPEEDFPARSHELGLKEDSGVHGYGEESEGGEKKVFFPARSDDVEVETELGRELPTGTHDQYSEELSRPKQRDDFDSSVEVTRDETQETEHMSYAEQIGSPTSVITDKAVATKNVVASGLGYYEETTGQHESPVGAESVDEKLTPVDVENVKETGSTETTKLPLSGGGSGEDFSAAEKVRPGEEDKALWGKLKEEREQGEAVAEEEKGGEGEGGGGMVGKIKGAYNYWLGGTTEEVKPKSPNSVQESSQSLGSTVGTKGFSDSGESGLGETGGGTTGAVPVQKGL